MPKQPDANWTKVIQRTISLPQAAAEILAAEATAEGLSLTALIRMRLTRIAREIEKQREAA